MDSRRSQRSALVLFAALAAAASAAAPALASQQLPARNTQVLVRVPPAALKRVQVTGGHRFDGVVAPGEGGVTVNGRADWLAAGFPWITSLRTVTAIRRDPRAGMTIVELRGLGVPLIRLGFRGADTSLFGVVTAPPDSASEVSALGYSAVAAAQFTGPLANIPTEQKDRLLRFAHRTANGVGVGSETFKERFYFAVDLGVFDTVFNDQRWTEAQRVAYVVNNRLLSVLKDFATLPTAGDRIQGLKLQYQVSHRNPRSRAEPAVDKLEVYATLEDIKRFAAADITSQELFDRAVVLVDGNRIRVPLAGA